MLKGASRTRPPRPRRRRSPLRSLLFSGLTGLLLLLSVFVFVWMLLTSLKQPRDVMLYPPVWLFRPTLENYAEVLSRTPFLFQLRNSAIVAVGAVLLGLLLGLPAAYSIARFRQRRIALTVLVVRMVPTIVFMLPLFVIFKQLGLIDTHLGLIFSHLILVLPLTIWVMMGFFEDVPVALDDQARIDGCSRWQAFWRIALPLSLPGAIVTTILSFITSWNNFIFVLMLGGGKTSTLPMAVFGFMGIEQLNFGGVAAAASLLSLPIIVLTLIVQRWLVQGLTLGAVK
jgi:multiple sugar transport system permease protein